MARMDLIYSRIIKKKKNTGARCDILAPITPNTYLPQLEMGELFFGIKMIEEAKFVWFIKGLWELERERKKNLWNMRFRFADDLLP